jgi:hypothetical protein
MRNRTPGPYARTPFTLMMVIGLIKYNNESSHLTDLRVLGFVLRVTA